MTDYVFECETGRIYRCKSPSCLVCQHCTDFFYDYSNGPYLALCELSKSNANHDCQDFLLDEYAVTIEEYVTRKQKKYEEEISKFNLSDEFEFFKKVDHALENLLSSNKFENKE